MKKYKLFITVFVLLFLSFASSSAQNGYDLFQKALAKERGEGNLEEAIALYQKVIEETEDQSLAAKAQLRIGICYEKLGIKRIKEAQKAYQKVIENYPGQTETVKVAQEKLSMLLRAQTVAKKGDKEFRIHRIWEGPDVDFYGAVSTDGNYISYTDLKTSDLAVWELATGKRRRLTTNPNLSGYAGSSIFSPDEKQIAFVWSEWDTELRLVRLDGSNLRTLFRHK
jgi:tetratricopeptide (TPR) repeat protein